MTSPASPAQAARLMKLATYASVSVAAVLILAKTVAYWQTSSVSILASLVDSLMDSGASLLNLFAVRYALEPADRQHRFGHGKAESIAALAQSAFIIVSGVLLLVEATRRLLNPEPIGAFGVGLAVMLLTIAATAVLLLFQGYVIRRTQSAAIRADALHYRTDLLTNSGLYILWSARSIMGSAFNELVDRELPDSQRAQIIAIAEGHPEVRGVHDLRTRSAGRIDFVEMHLELDGSMPLVKAHRISDEVEAAVIAAMPGADVVIHQDPAGIVEVQQDEQLQ